MKKYCSFFSGILIGLLFVSLPLAAQAESVTEEQSQASPHQTTGATNKEGVFKLEGQEKAFASSIDNIPIKMVDPKNSEKILSEKMFTDMAKLEIQPISGFGGSLKASLVFNEDLDKETVKSLTIATVERLRDKAEELGVDSNKWGLRISCVSKLKDASNKEKDYGTAVYDPFLKKVDYTEAH